MASSSNTTELCTASMASLPQVKRPVGLYQYGRDMVGILALKSFYNHAPVSFSYSPLTSSPISAGVIRRVHGTGP